MRKLALLSLLPACAGGGLMTGAIATPADPTAAARSTTAPASSQPTTGVELRMFGATEKVTPEYPNTFGWQVRQLGEEHVQYSMQAGWTVVRQGTPMVFGRLMFDMLSWEKRMDGDNTLSAFSPTLDFGVAPWGKGLCVSASTTYDVHFDAPDRWIAGVFVGVCAGRLK